jgi:Zn-dependent M28 family amino/carboxypeptidase
LAQWVEKVRIPALQISPYLAETLVEGLGRSFRDVAQSAETGGGITPLPLPGTDIDLTTSVNRHVVPDRNVVGVIEGSDAALKDEVVILCAHYDHTGVDAGGQVYNGADDDGSGTVALIEIAQAYVLAARESKRPRRSVLFAAWNSEEVGLLGAWAYAENPLFPLENTVAVLNMDMIGRNQEVPENGGRRFRGMEVQSAESNQNSLNIVGHTYSEDILTAVNTANRHFGLEIETGYDAAATSIIRRSDHWPFLQRGVPAILLTTGFHPDYHRTTDDVSRINFEKLEKIVRLTHQVSWDLARQDSRPKMNPGKERLKTK